MQILREAQPLFFLGAQHGIQYAALADPALVLGTGDVVENPLDEQHAERDAERSDDAHPHEKLRRHVIWTYSAKRINAMHVRATVNSIHERLYLVRRIRPIATMAATICSTTEMISRISITISPFS